MKLTAYDKECLAEAKRIIDNDISQHFTIAALAQKVGIGATKLKSGFKQLNGLGLYEYLKNERMKTAFILLNETEKTIKQIARAVGFKHTNNFITAFKNFYNISPGKIRNRQLPG